MSAAHTRALETEDQNYAELCRTGDQSGTAGIRAAAFVNDDQDMAQVRRDLRRTSRKSTDVFVALNGLRLDRLIGALRAAGGSAARRQRPEYGFELTAHAGLFKGNSNRRRSRRLEMRDQAQHVASSLRVTTVKTSSAFDQVDRTLKFLPRTILDLSHILIQSKQTPRRKKRPHHSI